MAKQLLQWLLILALFSSSACATLPQEAVPGVSEMVPKVVGVVPRVAEAASTIGAWHSLGDMSWELASTGWLAVANDGLPTQNFSLQGNPISIGGIVYERGLGTYPPSEIAYSLNGEYSSFEAEVGINDDSERGTGRFMVLVDDVLSFDSGIMRTDDPAKKVKVDVTAAKELRLLTSKRAGDPSVTYTSWANPRLFRSLLPLSPQEGQQAAAERKTLKLARAQEQENEQRLVDERARAEAAVVRGLPLPSGSGGVTSLAGTLDRQRGLLVLRNDRLGITFGFGGQRHGQLNVLDLPRERLVFYDTASSISVGGRRTVNLHNNTVPESSGSYEFVDIHDSILGDGKRLRIRLKAKECPLIILVTITLFRDSPYLLYELAVEGNPDEISAPAFNFFGLRYSNLVLGEQAEYITDFSRLRRAKVGDDSLLRQESVGLGKPVFVWNSKSSYGAILASLDETRDSTSFGIQLDEGRVVAGVGFRTGAALRSNESRFTVSSPRFYIEPTCTRSLCDAFQNYRQLVSGLHPQAPLPNWVKYQWLSWYVYFMDIDEDVIRQQIDYIAENLADLGPWHIIVDAGWYVAEGRRGAEWRNVDEIKFPSGLRSLVDYAHSKGLKVVLYFSAPYLDSRQQEGDWLGLRDIIEKHPEWLIPIGEDVTRHSYVYDFSNPELREYMKEVMKDYFLRYNVDGLKLDGLGNAEGALVSPDRLDRFGLVETATKQTMDIYRFVHENTTSLKEDVYIESGWNSPVFANPYAHTFRYGDESTRFSSHYPFPGLLEHIQYAIIQKMLLGQRANMGAIFDDPNRSDVNRWWLQAGLALGTQVSVSFDLWGMSPETLSRYRAILNHYNAFEGMTYVPNPLEPRSFATRVGELTYLGVLNPKSEAMELSVNLSEHGLSPEETYLAYDVTRGRGRKVKGSSKIVVPGESFCLFLLRREPGMLWTNSSYQLQNSERSMRITVRGPASIEGIAGLYIPHPEAVHLDGQVLARVKFADLKKGTFSYHERSGILSVKYDHDQEHEIYVEF
ncbi:MAG: NPCBM/NEW2 domain-containing protein [Chloroflexota bacterium]